MTTVAVLGLGAMGSRIARRLLDPGRETLVWNRDATKAVQLVEAGATAVVSPAEAAARADVLITMLSDPTALEDITRGPTGLPSGAHDGLSVIEMSTVGPDAVWRLRSALPDRTALIDAPVLGSISEAEAGSLTIYAGGSPPDIERSWSILSLLGKPMHTGPLGTGAAAKLVANMALFGVLGLLGESVALARALGLTTDVAFNVLDPTPLGPQAERRRPAIETGSFDPRFALSLAQKDCRLIAGVAHDLGVPTRIGRAACTWFDDAAKAGRGAADYTAVLAHILDRARDDPL